MSNFLKKSFLISMVVLTAMWGVVGVVDVASANVAVAGDLIKSTSSPAVYYLDSSLVKHPFHHEREYVTWYSDFSGVKTVPTDEMVSYSLGSTVVVRPGTRLVQYVEVLGDGTWNVSNTPEVYAVGSSGELHKIDSAATAVAKYGSAWESMIVPLPNYLSANYTTGSQMTSSATYPTGTLVKTAAASQVYYIDGTTKRPVTDAGFTANRFDMDYVLTVADLTGYTDGTSITAVEAAIAQPMAGSGAVATGTGLTVALASTTPGTQVAPGAATNVPLMRFNLTASADGAVTVSQINVKRAGIGDANDFDYLYLYDGATRLTNGKTINSTTHVAQFTVLNLSIPAGTTKTLTLSGDVPLLTGNATAGNVHYFMIVSGAITTTAAINGSFPVSSNTTTIGSSTAGSIVIDANGTLPNPVVGQNDAAAAQFKLTAGTGEDLELKNVTLYQAGSINNNYLSDFKLWQGTTQLASVASVTTKGLIVFDLSATPYTIAKNTNKIFKVTVDFSGSARNSDTTKIYLENNADLLATGKLYGYGASVDADEANAADDLGYDGNDTSCTTQATCSDSTYLVVQGGQITVAMNGPQPTTLAKGATGVTMMNFAITSGINAELRKIHLELHNDAAAGSDIGKTAATDASTNDSCYNDYIGNVKIIDVANGESTTAVNCSGFTDIDSADGVYYNFTDYFTFTAGQTRNFAVKADLHTSLDADDYLVILGRSGTHETTTDIYTISGSDGIKNLDNNQWVTDIVPTTSTQGNEMTISAANLGWALASNAAETTVIQGNSNVNLGEFAFNAGQGSAITISSMTFTGYIATTSPISAGSVKSTGCSATNGGNYYCAHMASEAFSYVNNLVSNLRLYDMTADSGMATNLNTTAEGLASADGKATFDNMAWTIPAGTTHILRVVGDVSSSAYNNGAAGDKYIKVNIAAVGDVSAQDADSSAVTLKDNDLSTAWAITQGNGAATTMASSFYLKLTNSGTLNVLAESNPPVANVVAGASNVPMLRLKFQGINEAFNVNKLRITEMQTATSTRVVSSVVISYQNQAGTTVTTSLPLSSGNADFNITSNPLYVPAGGTRIVNVYYNLAAIVSTSATYTADIARARFVYNANFEAKGAGNSSTNLTDTSNDIDVTGSAMTVHGTLPTFTADTTTSNALANGAVELYRMQVSAAEGDSDVSLKKLTFRLSLTDTSIYFASMTLDDFQIFEGSSYADAAGNNLTQGDTGTDSYQVYNGWGATGTTATGATGGKLSASSGRLSSDPVSGSGSTASSTFNVMVVFNDDRLIPAGNSKYYILKASANGIDTGTGSTDSASVYLYNGDTSTTSAQRLTASCDLIHTGASFNQKYCLTDMTVARSSAAGEVNAYLIWSDNTGVNGNITHQDVNGEVAYDGTGVTVSKDWFNGYKLKTLDVQRSLN